jgi:hypothetical protein
MCTQAISTIPGLGGLLGCQTPAPVEEENKVAAAAQKVLDAKKAHVKTALDNKWERYSPILIGGDFFSVGYLAFQGVQSLAPSIAQIAAIAIAGLVCGVIAGGINVGVGVISLKESIQAFHNGDKVLGARLLLDFICWTSIGIIMILASLAIKVTALAAIGAFFAAHPWVLPVLFFVATIPLLVELGYRIQQVFAAKDLASQLKLDELKTLLESEEPDWEKINNLSPFNLKDLENKSDDEQIQLLSGKMEELQADMGVEAAVEVFELLKLIQEKNAKQALEKIKIAKEKVEEWNRSLYVRMFQQILYIVGFIVSMVALGPHVNGGLLNGIQSFFLTGANVIPLYMDTFWPFRRNTPMVVPKVEMQEVTA